MGNLCGGNLTDQEKIERKRNKLIEQQNVKDSRVESKKIKLLLLGTGESGKSTIFKQVRKLYGENFTESELRQWAPRVHENINKQILAIYKATKKLGIDLANSELGGPFDNYDPISNITPDIADKMKDIWGDKGFQRAWERRAEYQVLDCIEYYMKEIDRIAAPGYVPTFQDIVYCRVRTSGIVQENFKMSGAPFEMYDVGGQRSERKKWLNCFDNVTTVLYVAAINEYDQVLFEDAKTDRIKEAINTWQDIVNREEFQNIGFVLFLNKYDLFEEKLKHFPFKVDGPTGRNQDYNGPDPMAATTKEQFQNALEQCRDYMQAKFMEVVEPRTGFGQVSVHFTIATDTNNMEKVFNVCREQILRRNLHVSGFGPQTI